VGVRPVHYYHLFAGSPLSAEITVEHFAALRRAGFDGQVRVGLVGPDRATGSMLGVVDGLWPDCAGVCAREREGFEQVTLTVLHEWARTADPATPVLYAHTKGCTSEENTGSSWGRHWRRSMTRHVVGRWRECVAALASGGYDAVGCHWLTPGEYPGAVTRPFFAGNFWWATAGYLAGLPPPGDGDRFGAEVWAGLGRPRVLDLNPGYPAPVVFGVTWDYDRRCWREAEPAP
jgi:hypothetical protein